MSKLFRALVTQRLTAAAEDICALFEQEVLLLSHSNSSQQERPDSQQHEPAAGVQIKEEQLQEPLFTVVCVKTEDDEDESSELHQRATEENREDSDVWECGAGAGCSSDPLTQLHSDSEDHTDHSEDYSQEQALAKRSYAMVPPDHTPFSRSDHRPFSYSDQEPFSCSDQGSFSLSYSHLLESSVMDHTPFSCSECGRMFPAAADLTRHKRKHTRKRPFRCSHCEQCFSSEAPLVRHKLQTHKVCSVCCEQLQTKAQLCQHLRKHVKDGTLDPGSAMFRETTKPYKCYKCGKRYKGKAQLQTHLTYHDKLYRCSVCEETVSSHPKLKIHMKIHTNPGTFMCSDCDRGFKSSATLSAHMKSHCEDRPFVCSVCGKGFVEQRDLTVHQKVVHHICPVCPEGFSDKVALTEHLRSHCRTDIDMYLKPFSCTVCGRRVPTEGALQSHMKVHSEERPFECSVCEKRFKTETAQTKHSKTHRAQCPVCLEPKDKNNLWSHLRNIHHMCSVCEQRFSDRAALKEHLKTHIEEGTLDLALARIHRCPDCGELFFYKERLEKHLREAHG